MWITSLLWNMTTGYIMYKNAAASVLGIFWSLNVLEVWSWSKLVKYFATSCACLHLFGHSYVGSVNKTKFKCRHLQNSGLSGFTFCCSFQWEWESLSRWGSWAKFHNSVILETQEFIKWSSLKSLIQAPLKLMAVMHWFQRPLDHVLEVKGTS